MLTSKYHYDRLTDPNDKEIAYDANRFGEAVPIHHKPSDMRILLGTTEIELKRISYAEMYNFLQSTVGRFVGGGFLGNKIKTRKSSLPQFSIGEFGFENIPVSFFDGAFGRQKFSVLGGDFLKRFNLVFDLENKALYFKKDQHFESKHF